MRENEEKDGREPKDPLSEVERLLRSLDRPGDYCAGGRMFAPMPALEVRGAGALSFPVSRERAEELFSRGRLSPFGKGTETLRDESVRSSREFEPGEISLGGGGWEKTVEELKDAAAEGLGCPRDRLEAEFYKLLVYAPGGFFLPHRDTEKGEGMVGTLVASLPVAGGSRGGEIAVRHGERETSLDMSDSDDPSEIAWAAFYADCPHEVRPVTEGHRIALVFNLLLRNGGGLRAADFEEAEREMTRALSAWAETAGRTEKIIALLDHDYSEAGLSFESLKNADASVARVLARAAAAAGCELHAALLDVYESAQPEYDRYGAHPPGESAFTGANLLDCGYDLENFTAPDGSKPGFGKIPFEKEEILPRGSLAEREPDEEGMDDEWLGNAEATYDRVYRLAGLALWPRKNTLFVVASGSRAGAVGYAETLAGRNDGAAREVASLLPEIWRGEKVHRGSGSGLGSAVDLLVETNDVSTLEELLADAVIPHYDSSLAERMRAALEAVGPEAGGAVPAGIVRANFGEETGAVAALAERLCRELGGSGEWRGALVGMCGEISRAFREILDERKTCDAWKRPRMEEFSPEDLRNLFAPFLLLNLGKDAARTADMLLDDPEAPSPDRVIPRALELLAEFRGSEAFSRFWKTAAGFLLERSRKAPEKPSDWAIGSTKGCGCEDCAWLKEFCEDPVATERRLTAPQARRDHLVHVIGHDSLDIDTRTEKKNRPYTLVCEKNRASHERRRKRYAEDVIEMQRLAAAAPPSAGELLESLLEAVGESRRPREGNR